MKAKILSASLALASLAVLGGTAVAAEDAHEGYQRGIYGKRSAAAETAASPAAPATPFVGPKGGTQVLTSAGIQPWDKAQTPAGKAAYSLASVGGSSADGHKAYRQSFHGD